MPALLKNMFSMSGFRSGPMSDWVGTVQWLLVLMLMLTLMLTLVLVLVLHVRACAADYVYSTD